MVASIDAWSLAKTETPPPAPTSASPEYASL
jgi:hypothetical protein